MRASPNTAVRRRPEISAPNSLKAGLARGSRFGFGVGPWAVWLWLCSWLQAAADTNNLPDASSSLRPPRGEILPTFWEQYGGWVIVASVVAVLGIGLLIWLVSRPKPGTPVPWSIQARQELEPLQGLPEDGGLLSRVSQILRRQVAAAFGLTSDEATTPEFCRALAGCPRIGPELTAELSDFLKESDVRKFAPSPPAAPWGAVGRSLRIVEAAEKRLAQLTRQPDSAATPDRNGTSPAAGEARLDGGV